MSILFVEEPLVLNTALAKIIGLNEAIVLQQIDYWVKINKKKKQNFHDGHYWTYNSLPTWHEETFNFWSFDTVKRTFAKLAKRNLIIKGNYNTMKADQTLWYTVNYEVVDKLGQENPSGQNAPMHNDAASEVQEPENPHGCASGQNAPMTGANCTNPSGQNAPTNTRDLPETSTEISKEQKEGRKETREDEKFFTYVPQQFEELAPTAEEPNETNSWVCAYQIFIGKMEHFRLSSAQKEFFRQWSEKCEQELICEIIKKASFKDDKFKYIFKTMTNLIAEEVTALEQYKMNEEIFYDSFTTGYNNNGQAKNGNKGQSNFFDIANKIGDQQKRVVVNI